MIGKPHDSMRESLLTKFAKIILNYFIILFNKQTIYE
jgi:hypothetical protein